MRPEALKTQIFLDSGNPQDTREALDDLGFLDGQTTNPSLIAKNPDLKSKFSKDGKLTNASLLEGYKDIVQEVRNIIPQGSISLEVYSDKDTSAQTMLNQAFEMNEWISNAHIKLPTTKEGLIAAEALIKEGINVNMTLVFTQAQAAAVYYATRGAKRGQVYLSPFIGRLDDIGLDGIDLIYNILKMYREQGDAHVMVLAASIRNLNHLLYLLKLGVDITTSPKEVLTEWQQKGLSIPGVSFDKELFSNQDEFVRSMNRLSLKNISYESYDLEQDWSTLDISHELTNSGLQKFADDWNGLIG